jgi:hypothetical protein
MDIAGGGMNVGEPGSARASIATLFNFSFTWSQPANG